MRAVKPRLGRGVPLASDIRIKLMAAENEQKQAQDALHETEGHYRALFDRSPDCLYVHDLQGTFLDANNATLRLLGYERDEIRGLNLEALLIEDQLPVAYEVIREVAETGAQKRASEFRLRCKNGDYVSDCRLKATACPRSPRGSGLQGILTDPHRPEGRHRALRCGALPGGRIPHRNRQRPG